MELIEHLRVNGIESLKRFYSLYMGIVISNNDPENRGRILVRVPEVFPEMAGGIWATSKGLIAGKDFGFNYTPKKDEVVLISFRFGHIRHPFWEPGFFAKGEKPEEFNENIVGMKYRDGALSIYDEEEGKMMFKTKDGDTLSIKNNHYYLELSNGVKFELSDEGVKLGRDNLESAVLGDTLKGVKEDENDLFNDIVEILVAIDAAAVAGQSAVKIPALVTKISAWKSKFDSFLAT